MRIPADVVRALGLKEGDDVELCALDAGQIAVIAEKQRRQAAIDHIRQLARPLPENYKFNREELYDR
ncbi:AbrB/MazE/SpoVT family DNA-binding domain-containing protein [uncultured Sphingomonas sp.]|uniref:AbrB/MazE/SpoVT family DNA-binding domain-containing protein n=1 Tax=uncultured Sphingomonas sp. TaxID=158754 RepID=UPI0035C9F4BD